MAFTIEQLNIIVAADDKASAVLDKIDVKIGEISEKMTALGKAEVKMGESAEKAGKEAASGQKSFQYALDMTLAKIRALHGELTAPLAVRWPKIPEENLEELAQANEALKQQTRELRNVERAQVEQERAAERAAQTQVRAQQSVIRQLDLTKAKLAELRGEEEAAFRLRNPAATAAQAKEYANLIELTEKETAAQRQATEAAREADRVQQERNRLQATFNRELAETQAHLAELRGQDSIARTRLRYGGVASDAEMQALRQSQQEVKDLEAAQRNANRAPGRPAVDRAAIERRAAGGRLAGSAASGAMTMASVLDMAGIGAAMSFADLDSHLVTMRNNTRMTNEEFEEMRAVTLRLGKETGGNFERIAEGYRHIRDHAFAGKDAVEQLTIATKAAVATGTSEADTAQLLSRIMREFNIPASQAVATMNKLWYSAANSDLFMKQLIDSGGQALAMAANMGLSFDEAAAALSIYAQRGLNAGEAAVQLRNDLNKIVSPAKQTHQILSAVTQMTGVDLVKAFTETTLKTKGLSFILGEMREAASRLHEPTYKLAHDLFPNLRGTIGALIGTSDEGFKGLNERIRDMSDITRGANPVQLAFARSLETATNELQRFINTMKADFQSVGKDFVQVLRDGTPVLKALLDILKTGLQIFTSLPAPVQQVILWFGVLKTASGFLGVSIADVKRNLADLILVLRGVPAAGAAAKAGLSWGAVPVGGAAAAGYGVVGGMAAGLGYMAYQTAQEQIEGARQGERGAGQANIAPLLNKISALEQQMKTRPSDALRKQIEDLYTVAGRMLGKTAAPVLGGDVGRASTFGGRADKDLWDRNIWKDIGGRKYRMGDSGGTKSGYNTVEHEGENYFAVRPDFAKAHGMSFGGVYKFQNPTTGSEVASRFVDYGPAAGTGRQYDFSPAMMQALGGQSDQAFKFMGKGKPGDLPSGQATAYDKMVDSIRYGADKSGNSIDALLARLAAAEKRVEARSFRVVTAILKAQKRVDEAAFKAVRIENKAVRSIAGMNIEHVTEVASNKMGGLFDEGLYMSAKKQRDEVEARYQATQVYPASFASAHPGVVMRGVEASKIRAGFESSAGNIGKSVAGAIDPKSVLSMAKGLAEEETITRRLADAQADLYREMRRAGHEGEDYQSMLAKLNMTSKDLSDAQRKVVEGLARQSNAIQRMKQIMGTVRGIFENAFDKLFSGGPKAFFASLIDDFKNTIKRMVVELIASKLLQLLMQALNLKKGVAAKGGAAGKGGAEGGASVSSGASGDWFGAAAAGAAFIPGAGPWVGVASVLKGLFHFSRGGFVPGSGHGDSVPAMLEPGEFVMSRKMVSETGTGSGRGAVLNVTQHIHGDVNSEADEDRLRDKIVTNLLQRMRYNP